MDGPRQHQNGYYDGDHSYYWEDREADHRNRHFLMIVQRERWSRAVLRARSSGNKKKLEEHCVGFGIWIFWAENKGIGVSKLQWQELKRK